MLRKVIASQVSECNGPSTVTTPAHNCVDDVGVSGTKSVRENGLFFANWRNILITLIEK
jgi:hypothetical protein